MEILLTQGSVNVLRRWLTSICLIAASAWISLRLSASRATDSRRSPNLILFTYMSPTLVVNKHERNFVNVAKKCIRELINSSTKCIRFNHSNDYASSISSNCNCFLLIVELNFPFHKFSLPRLLLEKTCIVRFHTCFSVNFMNDFENLQTHMDSDWNLNKTSFTFWELFNELERWLMTRNCVIENQVDGFDRRKKDISKFSPLPIN